MELSVVEQGGKKSGKIEVSDETFGQAFNETLVHQVVTSYLNSSRAGTFATLTRAEVRGGGAKPWRQKGTGRARAGTSSSPIWRGGGMTFAKKPRSFETKINRKMYRSAMRSILSELVRQERIIVLKKLEIQAPKTKLLIERLSSLSLKRVMIVIAADEPNIFLAARNIPDIEVRLAQEVSPVDLIRWDQVLIESAALKILEERVK